MKFGSTFIATALALATSVVATPDGSASGVIHPTGQDHNGHGGRPGEHGPPGPQFPGFNYAIDRNYTSDVHYEKVDISLTDASFYHPLAIVDVKYNAAGTVYADKEDKIFVPYQPKWTLVNSWEPGYWPNGYLRVDFYSRLDPRNCTLDVKFLLSGSGAVLEKMNEVVGPDSIGDDEFKSLMQELGVCPRRGR